MAFKLEGRVALRDGNTDYPELAGEQGVITNDWLSIGGSTVYAVTLDGGTVVYTGASQLRSLEEES